MGRHGTWELDHLAMKRDFDKSIDTFSELGKMQFHKLLIHRLDTEAQKMDIYTQDQIRYGETATAVRRMKSLFGDAVVKHYNVVAEQALKEGRPIEEVAFNLRFGPDGVSDMSDEIFADQTKKAEEVREKFMSRDIDAEERENPNLVWEEDANVKGQPWYKRILYPATVWESGEHKGWVPLYNNLVNQYGEEAAGIQMRETQRILQRFPR
jgi:hypothetical protein